MVIFVLIQFNKHNLTHGYEMVNKKARETITKFTTHYKLTRTIYPVRRCSLMSVQ
jgi:hypothetical protein